MNRHTGQRLGLRAHIAQSMADILTTPLGSRVMRRDYGSLVPELLDHPNNELTRLRVYSAAASALAKWEPRVHVSAMSLLHGEAPGQCVLQVRGTLTVADRGALDLRVPMTGALA